MFIAAFFVLNNVEMKNEFSFKIFRVINDIIVSTKVFSAHFIPYERSELRHIIYNL